MPESTKSSARDSAVWAAILAVAMHPIQQWLRRVLGGRGILSAFLLTAVALLIVLGPVAALGTALVENLSAIATGIQQGTVTVPPPSVASPLAPAVRMIDRR